MNFKKLLKKNGLLVKLHHSWIKSRIPVKYRETEDIELTPIFIIGTNRSGTSMVTSLLSQHPDLEGIFPDEIKPTFKDNTAHTIGYCESNIWPWLRTPFAEYFSAENIGDAVLWCHPKYISKGYCNNPKNKKEILTMANAVYQYRKTNKHPLIKDQFNLLRIGLIKKAIPLAKFVLVIRDYDDYFHSCIHKWFTENDIHEHSSIATHWITGNLLAYCDLQEYAINDHAIINSNQLLGGQEEAQELMDSTCNKLGLTHNNFNFELINKRFRYNKDIKQSNTVDFNKLSINDILMEYKKIKEGLKNQSNK